MSRTTTDRPGPITAAMLANPNLLIPVPAAHLAELARRNVELERQVEALREENVRLRQSAESAQQFLAQAAPIDELVTQTSAHLMQVMAEVSVIAAARTLPTKRPDPKRFTPHPLAGVDVRLSALRAEYVRGHDAGARLLLEYNALRDLPDLAPFLNSLDAMIAAVQAAVNYAPEQLYEYLDNNRGWRYKELREIRQLMLQPPTHDDDACLIGQRLRHLRDAGAAKGRRSKNTHLWRAVKSDIAGLPTSADGLTGMHKIALLNRIEDEERGRNEDELSKRISKLMHDHQHCVPRIELFGMDPG